MKKYLNRAYVDTSGGLGSFRITLPKTGLKLAKGLYWVSVQANMDIGTNGQWGWATRSVQTNNPATWQNPGDGFGSGCTTWANMDTCLGAPGPDLMFQLKGNTP